jgi:6,7-dimethyl-8-ribityllumazine synthase
MSDDKLEFFESTAWDTEGCSVAIVASRYNAELVDDLLSRVVGELERRGVTAGNVFVERVPGAHEIPYAADILALSGAFDVVIALGVVLAGETDHHSVITSSLARVLMELSCRARIPVINGVLCVASVEQAVERISGQYNRGAEFAGAALEMVEVQNRLWGYSRASLDPDGTLGSGEDAFDDN